MNCFLHHRRFLRSSAILRMLALAVALLFPAAHVVHAANVRFWFPLPYIQNQNDTNSFTAVPISQNNIQSDGGVQAIGIPIRIQPDINGYATNYFGPGWYAITEPVQRIRIVINVYDSSAAQYDYTNLLQSGFNTYVVTVYGTNPPPYYDEITNALGYDPFALITAVAATGTNNLNSVSNSLTASLTAAIAATNTANLTTTTGLVNNAGAQLTNAIIAAAATGTNNLNSASNSLTASLTAVIAATNTANLTTTTGLVNNAGTQLTNAITAAATTATNNLNSVSNSLTASLTAAIAATNTANLTTTTGLVNNASSAALSNLQSTNSALITLLTIQSNLLQFVSAQVGHDTNYLIIPTAGVANVAGTDVWSGFSYTNLNGVSFWSNNVFYASGIAAYGSIYVVGTAYTNLSGSNPVPVPAFAIKSIAAGSGVSIANNFGSQVITATGSGGTNTGYSIVLAGTGIGVVSNNTAGIPIFTISNTGTNSPGTNATTVVISGTGILVSSNNVGGIPQFTITADTSVLATLSTATNIVNSLIPTLTSSNASVIIFASLKNGRTNFDLSVIGGGTNAASIVLPGTGVLVASNNVSGIPEFTASSDTSVMATTAIVTNLVNASSNSLTASFTATNANTLNTVTNLVKSSGSNYLQAISGVGTNLTMYNPLLMVNSNSSGIFVSSITFSGFTNTSADGTYNYNPILGGLTNANGNGYVAGIIDPNNTNGTISGITTTNSTPLIVVAGLNTFEGTNYNGVYYLANNNLYTNTQPENIQTYTNADGFITVGKVLAYSIGSTNATWVIGTISPYNILCWATNYPSNPSFGSTYNFNKNGAITAAGSIYFSVNYPTNFIPNFTNILSPGTVFVGTIPGVQDYAVFSPNGNQQSDGLYTNYVINEWNTNGTFSYLNGSGLSNSVAYCVPSNAENGSTAITVPGTASGTSTQPAQLFEVGQNDTCVSTTFHGATNSPCDCPGVPRIAQ